MNARLGKFHDGGFAMLEVLFAIVILAFGMLGIAGVMLTGHKANSSSYIKQQAVQSAYDIVDLIHANSAAAVAGNYNFSNLTAGNPVYPPAPSPDCSVSACSASQLATYDIWYWLSQDVAQLPRGSGSIVTSPGGGTNTQVVITVQWDDSPAQNKLGADTVSTQANLAQFTLQTLL